MKGDRTMGFFFVFELLAFFAFCFVIALPIVAGVILYDEWGGGPLGRAKTRADRKARKDYLRGLTPEARAAFLHHEARKRAYARLGLYERYPAGAWDDVVMAADLPRPWETRR